MKNQNYTEVGIGKYSWSYIIKWLIVVMILYALCGGLLVSHPFAFTRSGECVKLLTYLLLARPDRGLCGNHGTPG